MKCENLFVSALVTRSALGFGSRQCNAAFDINVPHASTVTCGGEEIAVFRDKIQNSKGEDPHEGHYRPSDDGVVRLVSSTARQTLAEAEANGIEINGVTIGSARGATASLERAVGAFKEGTRGGLSPHTSPSTTGGVVAAAVGQLAAISNARTVGALFLDSTSMTCSSAFHALITGVAFLRGGMASAWLFGGAESCLTPFTMAQLDALRICSRLPPPYVTRPCAIQDGVQSHVALGEGAGTALLTSAPYRSESEMALLGIGWALEATPSATGITEDGLAFESSMQSALEGLDPGESVDAVVLHAPGTHRGDSAELSAIRRVFSNVPTLCTTKHLTGHTYGASGMLSLELARYLLEGGAWRGVGYRSHLSAADRSDGAVRRRAVLINAAGFGGNAVSILVGRR